MIKRLITLLIALALAAFLLAGLPGCGDEEETATDTTTEQIDMPADTDADEGAEDAAGEFDELADIEATVEVIVDGETTVVWSQKEGNWRWQDPANEESYVIYNAEEEKLWVVNNKIAQESEGAGDDSMYWGMSPAGMLGLYTMLPGTMSDDTYEVSIPGEGRVVIEMKGPEGLPSRFAVYDADDNVSESIEFEYSDVGNVSDDLFELPDDVTIQEMPDIPDIPVDGSIPDIPELP